MTRQINVIIASALALAACGGASESASTAPAPTPTTPATDAAADEPDQTTQPGPASTEPTPPESPPATMPAVPTTTGSVPGSTEPAETAPADPEVSGPFADLVPTAISVLTPSTGNGPKPLLAWEPVDGATTYDVVVSTVDGAPYWAWRGTEQQVWLGGSQNAPAPDTEGPILVGPMLLTVFASDAGGIPLAAGGPLEIAP